MLCCQKSRKQRRPSREMAAFSELLFSRAHSHKRTEDSGLLVKGPDDSDSLNKQAGVCALGSIPLKRKGNFLSFSKLVDQGIRTQKRGSKKHPLHLSQDLFPRFQETSQGAKLRWVVTRSKVTWRPLTWRASSAGHTQPSRARLPWGALGGGPRRLQLRAIKQ